MIFRTNIRFLLPAFLLFALTVVSVACTAAEGGASGADDARLTDGKSAAAAARRGYRWLTEKAYLPADFSQQAFDASWHEWPEPLRSQAAAATPAERRQLAFARYGLTPRPDSPDQPLQYVVDAAGRWTMNCFACHGGQILGKTVPGLPNSRLALETLTADIRATKLRRGEPLTRMDIGSLVMPLGRTNGTTNAVMFGVALMAYRDAELNIYPDRIPPRMVHHDMDAPAWWNFGKKRRLYADDFARKDPRTLMQFMLVQENGPAQFREWEADFQDVYRYLESLEPPAYPFSIDHALADRGRAVFSEHCARCHGTYAMKPEDETYPEVVVPMAEIGTDPVRLEALTAKDRLAYGSSWFAYFGEHKVLAEPGGYVAPPLDGIWASAPYFHNGSVPTLWHLLHPAARPAVWKQADGVGYDQRRVGLEVTEYSALPATIRTPAEARQYFNTTRFGKSNQGHLFPEELSEEEKQAVLEYLKTL